LALALHPDKNGAPGADEAFKSVYPLRDIPHFIGIHFTSSGFQSLSGTFWFVFDQALSIDVTSHVSVEQTHKNGQYSTAVEVTLSQGSAACRLRGLHQDSRPVHSAAPRLTGSSAQRIFSTCSLAAVQVSVAISVAVQVNLYA
jgi:hypothetical protein